MKSNYIVHYSLALVVLAHLLVILSVIYAPQKPQVIDVIPPAIQGMIVAAEPVEQPAPPASTPPPQKIIEPPPVSKISLPKAPPSERAVQQEQQLEPQRVVEQAVPLSQATPAVSDQVIMPNTDAAHINNAAPVYPAQSRRAREVGVVVLEILVLANGNVGEMRLKTSSGYSRLDQAAQNAVRAWRFVPAKRGTQAIDFWYELPIEFSLK